MLHAPSVLTIHRNFRRAPHELLGRFRGVRTSYLTDAMDGRGALDYRIKPLDPGRATFAGSALTAHAFPADMVGVIGALHEAQHGDAIVLSNEGFTATASIGEIFARMIYNKGVAAFVTDGLARDKAGIVATRLPVFCSGVTANSPACTGLGSVGAPITIAGTYVMPGDIVVGDEDAVVIVPLENAEAVLRRVEEIRSAERIVANAVEAGATFVDSMKSIISNARIVSETTGRFRHTTKEMKDVV